MSQYIRINPSDNVAVALSPLKSGTKIALNGGIILQNDIPSGHKFALTDIPEGGNVVKYGFPIGHLICNVSQGCHIDHNILKTNLEGISDYTYTPNLVEIKPADNQRTFLGFRRNNGSVGVRNQIWIIPTVGCVNGIAQKNFRAVSCRNLRQRRQCGCCGGISAQLRLFATWLRPRKHPQNYPQYGASPQCGRSALGGARLRKQSNVST